MANLYVEKDGEEIKLKDYGVKRKGAQMQPYKQRLKEFYRMKIERDKVWIQRIEGLGYNMGKIRKGRNKGYIIKRLISRHFNDSWFYSRNSTTQINKRTISPTYLGNLIKRYKQGVFDEGNTTSSL